MENITNEILINGKYCLCICNKGEILPMNTFTKWKKVWFGLVCLFNGISTFYGLFNAKLELISKYLIVINYILNITLPFLNYTFLYADSHLFTYSCMVLVFLYNTYIFSAIISLIVTTPIWYCPVGWCCRIHRLLLRRGVRPRPHNECPGYCTKQSDGEVPVMLELWGM